MISIEISSQYREPICLGRRGENEARQIIFDLSEFISTYGPGTAQLLHQRSRDSMPYIAQAVQDGNTLTWTVSAADTATPGASRAELRWYAGDVLAKSTIYLTRVWTSLADPSSFAPEEYHSDIELLIDGAGEAVNRAEAAADRVEQAAAQSGYMFFDIDQHGHLIYNRTASVDVDFTLEDGRLIVHGN